MWLCFVLLEDGVEERVDRLIDFANEGSAWMAASKLEKDNHLPDRALRLALPVKLLPIREF